MYDPTVGQFLEDDPIGFDGGDTNLMRFCGNDPINGTDPSGLEEKRSDVLLDRLRDLIANGGNPRDIAWLRREITIITGSDPIADGRAYQPKATSSIFPPTSAMVGLARGWCSGPATPVASKSNHRKLTSAEKKFLAFFLSSACKGDKETMAAVKKTLDKLILWDWPTTVGTKDEPNTAESAIISQALGGNADAITIGSNIFLNSLPAENKNSSIALIGHETSHAVDVTYGGAGTLMWLAGYFSE